MLGRLIVGIVKGLVVGALVGFALVKLGMAAPAAFVAYLAAAATGVLIGLVAGKPIWAKDAKIEAGMKAFVGALLASALLYPVRRFLTMPIPFPLGELGAAHTADNTIGSLAMTSLAAVAALLGGFYEADNDATDDGEKGSAGASGATASKARVAAELEEADDEEEVEESDKKRAKK